MIALSAACAGTMSRFPSVQYVVNHLFREQMVKKQFEMWLSFDDILEVLVVDQGDGFVRIHN